MILRVLIWDPYYQSQVNAVIEAANAYVKEYNEKGGTCNSAYSTYTSNGNDGTFTYRAGSYTFVVLDKDTRGDEYKKSAEDLYTDK